MEEGRQDVEEHLQERQVSQQDQQDERCDRPDSNIYPINKRILFCSFSFLIGRPSYEI